MRVCLVLLLLLSVSCVHRPEPFTHDVATPAKPWTHEAFRNDPEAFQFAILTDRTGGMREGIFASAVTKVNLIQPEFVVSVGDYIQGYTTDLNQLNTEWEEIDHLTSRFEMPFFFLPGNHDITNPTMQNLYEERFGSRYYAFVYKGVLFVCLDTQDHPISAGEHTIRQAGLRPEQIEWAREVLRQHADARWTFVLMHQPLWQREEATGWEEIEAALGDREFTVVAGHLHHYTKYVRRDKNYFILATTGGGSQLRGPEYGEFDHAVWVTMAEDGPRIANLLLDGIRNEDVYTEHTDTFRKSLNVTYVTDRDQRTITGTLRISNPFHHPLTVAESWTNADVPGWQLTTTIDSKPISPKEEKTYTIEARYEQEMDMARFPKLALQCAAGSELNGVFPLDRSLQRAYLGAVRPRLVLPKIAAVPTIDGTITDAEWAEAASITEWVNLDSPTPATDQATVWCAYDAQAFYLAGRFVQDPANLRIQCTEPGHALWEDDSIELFFDPNRDEKTYAQAMITANRIARLVNLEAMEIATGRTGDAWTVEISVPWEALSAPEATPGGSIGFNLRRNRTVGEQRRVSEWTSTLTGNPHAPDLFGILELQ